jgi:hypothetical protein
MSEIEEDCFILPPVVPGPPLLRSATRPSPPADRAQAADLLAREAEAAFDERNRERCLRAIAALARLAAAQEAP